MYKAYRKLNPKADNKNWQILFNTQFQNMQELNAVSTLWVNGLAKMGLDNSRRPTVPELNRVSKRYTGYTYIQTQQNTIMSAMEWYKMALRYEMPITNFVRKPSELDYCDEPDSFHEILGHVVLYTDKEYSDIVVQKLSRLYLETYAAKRDDLLKEVDFLGAYIYELGLMKEPSGIKAIGATLYSSGEVKEAYKKKNQRVLGNNIPKNILAYDRSKPQGLYYIIESLEQLNGMLNGIEKRMRAKRS